MTVNKKNNDSSFQKKSYNNIRFYEKPKRLIMTPWVIAKGSKLVTWRTVCILVAGRHSGSQLLQAIVPGREVKASSA